MSSRAAQRTQSGIALVVALILLVVITLVGLAAIRGTTLQQKMTANFYDRELAFQAAEAALRTAERVITATPQASFIENCSADSSSGVSLNKCEADPFGDSNLPAGSIQTVASGDYDPGPTAAGQPQYVIQYLGTFAVPDPDVKILSNCSGYGGCANRTTADYYRVTARSGPADVGDRAVVTLQTTFRQ